MAKRKLDERQQWFDGGHEVAMCVTARIEGFPTHAIEEYRKLKPRIRWKKRELFLWWVKQYAAGYGLSYNWLAWSAKTTDRLWKRNNY